MKTFSLLLLLFSVTSRAEFPKLDKPLLPNEGAGRFLASGNIEDDLTHYKNLTRRLGIDIGMLVPSGDFVSEFGSAPAFGVHFTWEAIPPFGLVMGILRSATSHKTGAGNGKLSITAINIGTQASFAGDRIAPFVQLGASFLFNDVSFNAGRTVTSGNDTNLTTVGIRAGAGVDFVIGREVSFGVECAYYYGVPKRISTTTTDFDLGSSFVTGGIRMNF